MGQDRWAESGIAFANRLRRMRTATGLTQEELALRSGVSARTISDMERGRVARPQRRTMRALAGILAPDESEEHEFHCAGRMLPEESEVDGPVRGRLGTGLELPPAPSDLTGRDREFAELLAAERGRRASSHATTVITVCGPPGVGKSAFVRHAAHRLAPRFADGCAHLRLGERTAEEALATLLGAFGVPPSRIPPGTASRASLFRALMRDRAVLLVLDDVRGEAQVRSLLPTAPRCLVLLAGSRPLAGLESVTRVPLAPLGPRESVRLLERITGDRRITDEPEAAAALAELCGHLPLALRIAGNRLAVRPRWRVEHLVQLLAAPAQRLTALTAGDLRVRDAFEESYRCCGETARAAFRRLSLGSGDVTIGAAALLAEIDRDTAEQALEELVDAGLLESIERGRYRLTDLLWLFAGERLHAEERPQVRLPAAARPCPVSPLRQAHRW